MLTVLTLFLSESTQSFEQVLANINKLNRNLEAVITVGNEFSSVEALWSTFENVMAKEEGGEAAEGKGEEAGSGDVDDDGQGEDQGQDETGGRGRGARQNVNLKGHLMGAREVE